MASFLQWLFGTKKDRIYNPYKDGSLEGEWPIEELPVPVQQSAKERRQLRWAERLNEQTIRDIER